MAVNIFWIFFLCLFKSSCYSKAFNIDLGFFRNRQISFFQALIANIFRN